MQRTGIGILEGFCNLYLTRRHKNWMNRPVRLNKSCDEGGGFVLGCMEVLSGRGFRPFTWWYTRGSFSKLALRSDDNNTGDSGCDNNAHSSAVGDL